MLLPAPRGLASSPRPVVTPPPFSPALRGPCRRRQSPLPLYPCPSARVALSEGMSAWPRLGDPRRNRESKAALTCAWEACLASDCGSRCSFGSILAIAKFARHTPPPLSAPGAPSPLHTFREAPLAPICAVFASRSPLSALLSPGTPCAALPGSSSCARTSMRSDLAPRDVRRPQEEAAPSTHDLEAAMFGGNGFGGAADWSEMVEHHEQEQAFGGLQAPGIADAGVSESEEESDSESESEGSDSGWQAHAEPPSTSSGQGQDDGKAKRAPVPVQQLSKKERKAKELEDLEQTLAELGIELKSGDASGAGAGAGAGAGEKKKKKKKVSGWACGGIEGRGR